MTSQSLSLAPEVASLYRFVSERGCFHDLDASDPSILRIHSGDVLAKIRQGDSSWEEQVPPRVVEVVKSRGLFGYRPGGPS
jgi:hypothetical protein